MVVGIDIARPGSADRTAYVILVPRGPEALDETAQVAREAILLAVRLEAQLVLAEARIRELEAEIDILRALAQSTRARF